MAQLECAASELPHEFVAAKSPVVAAAISVNATSPAFVSITFCAVLVVPSACAGKISALGDSESVAGSTAAPANVAVSSVPSPKMVNVPASAPEDFGVKAIATVQPVLGCKVAPHVFAEMLKSPVTAAVPSVT